MTGSAKDRPILVTGSHRSGTTWTGRLLTLSGEAHEIHEPFNPVIYKTWFREPAEGWFQHVGAYNEGRWKPELERVVGLRPATWAIISRGRTPRAAARAAEIAIRARVARSRRRRALIKDPIAFFAAEWLAAAFATMNVVLVRHPAAFASSLKRLDWQFDFRHLLDQDELMGSLLKPFEADLRAAVRDEPDVIEQAILAWRIFAACTIAYRELHPDWLVLRYEDLAADPVAGFRSLYQRLELTWSMDVEQRIQQLTGAGNVTEVPAGDRGGVVRHSTEAMWTWLGRLTPLEIERVREGTADASSTFYGDADWRRSDTPVEQ